MASKKVTNIYIKDAFSLAGPLESEGKIANFDIIMDDYYYHEKTFEQAEIKMQKTVIDNLLRKNNLLTKDINFLVSGDLVNQIGVSSYTASLYDIPFLGVYSACASFIESLIVASEFLSTKRKGYALCVTSSHNLHAEKQFRFPIEYGAPKSHTTTFTATGAVGALLSREPANIKIESYTIGQAIDMGIKDATNMGAVMAPAAANTILQHLEETVRTIDYYDLILTGDLGSVGLKILKAYLKQNNNLTLKNYLDAGCELYLPSQEVYSGASGPVVLPLYFFNKIVKQNKYHKILLVGTGSLHNALYVNQKKSIPAISHAISLEVN